MAIRAVIFDVGGVLFHQPDKSRQRCWEERIGLAKPDGRIYSLALDRLQVRPAEAIFIDDVQANVEAAQAIGMAALRFENTGQTIMEIEQYLNRKA